MYQCPECPAAAFCSHEVQTRPASVTAESLAALEQRLSRCESMHDLFERDETLVTRLAALEAKFETLYKAHEVNRRFTAKRLDSVEPDITRLMQSAVVNEDTIAEARELWDLIHADTRKRVTALEQAASQQPSRNTRKSPPPARGRSRTKASKTGRKRGASSPPRKRASAPRKR